MRLQKMLSEQGPRICGSRGLVLGFGREGLTQDSAERVAVADGGESVSPVHPCDRKVAGVMQAGAVTEREGVLHAGRAPRGRLCLCLIFIPETPP